MILVLLMVERIVNSVERTEKRAAKLAGHSEPEAPLPAKSTGSTVFMVVILCAFGAAAFWSLLK